VAERQKWLSGLRGGDLALIANGHIVQTPKPVVRAAQDIIIQGDVYITDVNLKELVVKGHTKSIRLEAFSRLFKFGVGSDYDKYIVLELAPDIETYNKYGLELLKTENIDMRALVGLITRGWTDMIKGRALWVFNKKTDLSAKSYMDLVHEGNNSRITKRILQSMADQFPELAPELLIDFILFDQTRRHSETERIYAVDVLINCKGTTAKDVWRIYGRTHELGKQGLTDLVKKIKRVGSTSYYRKMYKLLEQVAD
jgi:hypothetical protein